MGEGQGEGLAGEKREGNFCWLAVVPHPSPLPMGEGGQQVARTEFLFIFRRSIYRVIEFFSVRQVPGSRWPCTRLTPQLKRHVEQAASLFSARKTTKT